MLACNEALPVESSHPWFEPGSGVELVEGYELEGRLPPGVTFDTTTGAFGGVPGASSVHKVVIVRTTNASARSEPCIVRLSTDGTQHRGGAENQSEEPAASFSKRSRLTEEHIAVLSGHRPDSSLDLLTHDLTVEDARRIAEHLKQNTTLTELR